ncbi:uncharacterized protein FTOL_08920 [Fusarium torulosum]|uniref:Uncharacterized protein n=1 Tax=Fusarium torulosum TaxID=33205 RepID=A0AAE8SKE1_9HYPO|nr:uncharacterized protein FTOL_08920 [Fusarium torulosum]
MPESTGNGTPASSTTGGNEPKLLPPKILEKVKKWARRDIEENNDKDKDTEEGGVKLDQGSDTEDGGVKL